MTNILLNEINSLYDHIASPSENLSQDILEYDLAILPYNIKHLNVNDSAKLPKPRLFASKLYPKPPYRLRNNP